MIPDFLKNGFLKNKRLSSLFYNPSAKDTDSQHNETTGNKDDGNLPSLKVVAKPYSKAPINQLYRKLSGQMLDVAVKPKLLGALPDFDNNDQILTFYVLQDYSRSNSILIDL